MKYILLTGGVISSIGKGVIASSFGIMLSNCNKNVTSIKIDPYINIDAGTFSPYEHGEVYVLDDGSEVDLDLGNYERFLDITLHKDNNITTGKIYQYVINKERNGDYLGKTVQVVPHITDAIQEWVTRVAKEPIVKNSELVTPEICIIELGGTIGDIEGMPFVEAFRQFQFQVKRENFCCIHVSLVPQPKTTGEAKTKPTQSSVRELRGLGLSPDLIVCRSEKPIGQEVKNKISNFCHVPPNQVICVCDLSSIYKVPLVMESQGVINFFNERLQLNIDIPLPEMYMTKWKNLANKIDDLRQVVNIALVGKYTKLEDAYASVTKALQHAAINLGYKLNLMFVEATHLEMLTLSSDPVLYHKAWGKLCMSDGVLVPGGFGKRGIEGKIAACKWCRENQKPYFGICLGLQVAVIEFARNVLGIKDANSAEVDPNSKNCVVIDMPEHNTGQMGGTMRLGKRETFFVVDDCKIKQLYGNKEVIEERHRHRYEVNKQYKERLEADGLIFVGQDSTGERMQLLELKNHEYFVASQFHPEYLSRPLKPSPPFIGLILAATGRLKAYLSHLASNSMFEFNGSAENLNISDLKLNDEKISNNSDHTIPQ